MNPHFELRPPSAEEYSILRSAAGWGEVSIRTAEKAMENSLFGVCGFVQGEHVACGRIVGDGSLYFYLQDIIVHPSHQGLGIGTEVTRRLLAWLKDHVTPEAFIGLMAAEGAAAFYEKFGFEIRGNDRPGMQLLSLV